jgi:hypothetical protein
VVSATGGDSSILVRVQGYAICMLAVWYHTQTFSKFTFFTLIEVFLLYVGPLSKPSTVYIVNG